MKIALIHSIYKPNTRGGAETAVSNIADGFKKRGIDFFVVSVGRQNKMEEIDGVRVYRIKSFNFFNFLDINSKPAWLRLLWHIVDMFNDIQTWQVYKVIKKENPDLIMTHNLKGLGYYLPWLFRILKIRHWHTVHDAQLIHPSGLLDFKMTWLALIYFRFCRKLFASPEKVIFPSNYIKEVYEKNGFFKKSEKIVLPNPICHFGATQPFRRKSRVKTRNPVNFLYLGQIEKYKGILELIKIIKEIDGDFALHIVGKGSVFQKAKKLAENDKRIIFYGSLSQQKLAHKIWPIIDVLINPSLTPESFGMVVAEALSQGIPCVCRRIGALPELIDGQTTGWLFDNNDEMKSIILNIIAKPNQIDIKKKGYLLEAEKFTTYGYLDKLLINW